MPVLVEGRQTVASCGPQPPDRITPSISGLWTTVEIVDKRCKNFRVAFPGDQLAPTKRFWL